MLKVLGPELSGHKVTNALSGKRVGLIRKVQSSLRLPAGIYNVTVGRAVWKSVQVKLGETMVLRPGWLKLQSAAITGHKVLEAETGLVHGRVSALKSTATLMPGQYKVTFGKLLWPLEIKPNQTTVLRPGVIKVLGAHVRGHLIRNQAGQVVGRVSTTKNWLPLPPGSYSVEFKGVRRQVRLRAGQRVVFK